MTGDRFEALAEFKWPSGVDKAAAILRHEPNELSVKYGIVFESGLDDLGPVSHAVLRLPSGRVVCLQRHDTAPKSGTSLLVDLADSHINAIAELSEILDLDGDAFLWVNHSK